MTGLCWEWCYRPVARVSDAAPTIWLRPKSCVMASYGQIVAYPDQLHQTRGVRAAGRAMKPENGGAPPPGFL